MSRRFLVGFPPMRKQLFSFRCADCYEDSQLPLLMTNGYEDSQLPLLNNSEDTAWHESNHNTIADSEPSQVTHVRIEYVLVLGFRDVRILSPNDRL
ncbi:hypothetical protein M758_1G122100 [Ceratodon purpureus]|nr:hypothetical protein M758_1G122100 [Ceratodon purpureus]